VIYLEMYVVVGPDRYLAGVSAVPLDGAVPIPILLPEQFDFAHVNCCFLRITPDPSHEGEVFLEVLLDEEKLASEKEYEARQYREEEALSTAKSVGPESLQSQINSLQEQIYSLWREVGGMMTMNPFFIALQSLIQSNTLTMRDIQGRIDYGVSGGLLSLDEAAELIAMLQKAPEVPDLPPQTDIAIRLGTVEGKMTILSAQFAEIKDQMAKVLDAISKIDQSNESGEPSDPGNLDEPGTPDEPEPEKPIGPPPGVDEWTPQLAQKGFAYGAQVWHRPTNAIWVSKVGNNKTEPGTADYAWSKID